MKHIMVLIAICLLMASSGCEAQTNFPVTGERQEMMNEGDKVATDMFDLIMEAIEEKDSIGLYELFSKTVQNEIPTLQDDINALIEVFQAETEQWESPGASLDSSVGVSCTIKKYQEGYDFLYNGEPYFFIFSGYTEDTTNPDNVGLTYIYLLADGEWDKLKEYIPGAWVYSDSSKN